MSNRPTIRKPWERQRVITPVGETSCTDTSFGNDTDINNIVARFARTGQMPPPQKEPKYADVTGLQGDLTEMLQKGKEATEAYKKLMREAEENNKNKTEADQVELQELRAKIASLEAQEPTGE